MNSKNVLALFRIGYFLCLLLVATALLVSCVSAVPSYEAVDVANYSRSDYAAGDLICVDSSYLLGVKYVGVGGDDLYKYTPSEDGHIDVTDATYLQAGAYDPASGYVYVDRDDAIYRLKPDGTEQSLYKTTSGDVGFVKAMAVYDGVLYGGYGQIAVNHGQIYREPFLDGGAWILLHDFEDDFDDFYIYGMDYLPDGSLLVFTRVGEGTERIHHFDSDYTYLMNWTLPFTITVANAGIARDENDFIWLIAENSGGNKLWKLSLPNLEYGEIVVIDLQGKTYDVDGNIVSGVTVEVGDESDISNTIGDYSFEDLLAQGGSLTVEASKSGYENYSRSLVGFEDASGYIHDIYLIPEGTLENGDIGGVVYNYCTGVVVANALVDLYDDDSDVLNYTYTNPQGFYIFEDIENNTNFTLWAEKADYEKSEKYSFQSDNTTYIIKDMWLLPIGGCGGLAPPLALTPTPTPPSGVDETPIVSGIEMLFELFGLMNYMGYILALLCILVAGGTFGYITSGNTMAIAIGCFFGFVIDVALGWLPVWLVAVVICVVIFLIVRQIREG